jgi:hypothetical protein
MGIDSSFPVEQDEHEEEHEYVVRVPEDFELASARVLGRGRVDEHHPHADDAAGEPGRVAEQRHGIFVGERDVSEMKAAEKTEAARSGQTDYERTHAHTHRKRRFATACARLCPVNI